MKSIMILGASKLQVPLLRAAKAKGLYTYVVDYDPEAVGFEYADVPLVVSTIDMAAVLLQAEKYIPDYIMTSTSDMPVRTVAYIREKLGMPIDITYNNALCATNKALMRERLQMHNIPIPQFFVVHNEVECMEAISQFEEKCVIKPADNAASRGVRLIIKTLDTDLLENYYYSKQYSRSGLVLVEEYMTGAEVSVEAITLNGKTEIIAITDKLVTPPPYFVELGHSEQSMLSDEMKSKIHKITIDTINAIGILYGPSHTEIKLTEEGPKIVEIAARLGGDYITSMLVPLSTGINLNECELAITMREHCNIESRKNMGSAIRFIPTSPGKITNITGLEEAKLIMDVVDIDVYKNIGETVNNVESSNDRIGHIITAADTPEEAINAADVALSVIKVTYE